MRAFWLRRFLQAGSATGAVLGWRRLAGGDDSLLEIAAWTLVAAALAASVTTYWASKRSYRLPPNG